jgi:hypothetical protein
LALHAALQKIPCAPLRFLRRIGAVICKHCSRCAVNFLLVFATPGHGSFPMGTRFAYSENHGANRKMAKFRTHSMPVGLGAIFLIKWNASINRTRMQAQSFRATDCAANSLHTTYRREFSCSPLLLKARSSRTAYSIVAPPSKARH